MLRLQVQYSMYRLFKILLPIFITILSCRQENRGYLTKLSGSPGEVLIVMSENDWNGTPGEACRELFSKPYDMLPQYEPIFDVVHITFASFKDFFRLHRNILIAEINPGTSETSMLIQKDQPAFSQLVITIQAGSDSAFTEILAENGERIITLYDELERQRIIMSNQQHTDQPLVNTIQEKYNVKMILPQGYTPGLDTTEFTWLVKEHNSIIQGILIYEYPYDFQEGITLEKLIDKRDEMLKLYVPGSVTGSYMTTEKEFQPSLNTYKLRGEIDIIEIRGLWKIENGISMGGSFISISIPDKQNKRIITAEGFVYAAGFRKRNYMRELEAIVLSID